MSRFGIPVLLLALAACAPTQPVTEAPAASGTSAGATAPSADGTAATVPSAADTTYDVAGGPGVGSTGVDVGVRAGSTGGGIAIGTGNVSIGIGTGGWGGFSIGGWF